MERTDLLLLRELLTSTRVLTLALLDDGVPVAGLTPFLADPGLDSLVVHGSRLARHVRALTPGAAFSAVIHTPDRPELDPLRLPRLLLDGEVAAPGADELEALGARWLAAFPSSGMTLGLGDFAFHRLRVRSGRLIAGFGRASGIGMASFAEAAALEP